MTLEKFFLFTNMEGFSNPEDMGPSFCIGQHESKRTVPITTQVVQAAHESNV